MGIIGGFPPLDLFLTEAFMSNRSAIDSSKSCEPPESNPEAPAVTKLTEEPPSPVPAYKPYANEPELPGALYKPYAKKPLPPGTKYEPYKGM